MQITPRGLVLLSITALFLLAATFSPVFLWLAAGWPVLACALLLTEEWEATYRRVAGRYIQSVERLYPFDFLPLLRYASQQFVVP